MKNLIFLLLLFCLPSLSVYAQNKAEPTPTPEDEEVVRISSELVLVDALVLDKEGRQVTDLTAADFEIYQDGKLQEVTSFSYVTGGKKDVNAEPAGKNKSAKDKLPVPPAGIRSNQGRIITFVIDDGNCLATPEGLEVARDGVKRFIDGQMLPDDRVAIYQTRGGVSLLQMYTSNKEVLRRLVNKVNWLPSRCSSAFDPARDTSTIKANGRGETSFESEETKEFKKGISENERENQVIGSVGVLGFVIDRLKVLPQRKLIFFISEGIATKFGDRAYSALREVADKASRSSVVIYTMGEKGLSNPAFISAQDEVLPGIIGGGDDTFALSDARAEEERALNEGLSYLAYSTGGKFIRNKNFLHTEIEKVLNEETGYYLLGYQPAEGTFGGRDFHRIQIKLKRDDLNVSSRKGFYGRDEKESRPKYKNANNPLYEAIASPFSENRMDIRLTTLVGFDAKTGSYIRALFHINGEDLTLTDEPGGLKKVVLDVVAVTLNEKGDVVEEFNYTYPIRIPLSGVETVRKNGLEYSADIPIKKAGFYSFRLAVRDAGSSRLGSVGDFVEIPKAKDDKLLMAGLITTSEGSDGKPLLPENRPAKSAFAPVFSEAIPSLRRHRIGGRLIYSYDIYNAKRDKATNQPQLTRQIRIYRDGKLLIEGKETTLEVKGQTGAEQIRDTGSINLGQGVAAGEYVLQVIVKDKLAGRTESQWIDFEVIG